MDNPFLPVDLGDLALPTLVLAAYNADLVILADGEGTRLLSTNQLCDLYAGNLRRTLCLPRSSFDRDEDMILRRTDEGASKCALRALRREEETSA